MGQLVPLLTPFSFRWTVPVKVVKNHRLLYKGSLGEREPLSITSPIFFFLSISASLSHSLWEPLLDNYLAESRGLMRREVLLVVLVLYVCMYICTDGMCSLYSCCIGTLYIPLCRVPEPYLLDPIGAGAIMLLQLQLQIWKQLLLTVKSI